MQTEMNLAGRAGLLINELARRRDEASRIRPVASVEILRASGQDKRAGKVLGTAIALVDAARTLAQRPWLGRLVRFRRSRNDFVGPWESWAPFKKYIVEDAPRAMRWQDEDLEAV